MRLIFLLAAAAIAGCTAPLPRAAPPAPTPAPESASATAPAGVISGVAAAKPHAVDAGIEILAAGGSAADAAVAIQAMLGLVEPQSSGIGGGGFLLYYEAATGKVTAFDGREAAPAGAQPDMFLDAAGEPMPYREAVVSGRSTGVPGAVAMLGAVHARHGALPWTKLFDPAIRAARDGVPMPKRMARFANGDFAQAREPDARAMFSRADGTLLQAGEPYRNAPYAETLARIASDGPRALLKPPLRDAIIARTHEEPRPGALAPADFENYQPRVSEPVCGPYLVYVVCVPPPPSSGVVLLGMLGILDRTDIAARGPGDPESWYLFAMASRLMYADRDKWIADPAFVPVPVEGLLAPEYIERRAASIGATPGPAPEAGMPAPTRRGADSTREAAGTSHFVVVDRDGDIVSMTTTVESLFGSGRAVGGFFLNNQLTDFSYRPAVDGVPVANAVAGGKRPRSSMAPVIVLDAAGKPVAALGSPGGSSILAYNAKALVGLVAWMLSMQYAINLPKVIARGDEYDGEVSKLAPGLADALAARGVVVKSGRGEESGLQGLVIGADGRATGAADPRREGMWKTITGAGS